MVYLLVSQLVPADPGTHVHEYPPAVFVQNPPFKHGFEAQLARTN